MFLKKWMLCTFMLFTFTSVAFSQEPMPPEEPAPIEVPEIPNFPEDDFYGCVSGQPVNPPAPLAKRIVIDAAPKGQCEIQLHTHKDVIQQVLTQSKACQEATGKANFVGRFHDVKEECGDNPKLCQCSGTHVIWCCD